MKNATGLAINKRSSELLQKYGWSNYNRINRARKNMLRTLDEKGVQTAAKSSSNG